MPLKASMSPSTTPRTRPCVVQATSGSSVAQFGACASALEVVAANRSSARTFLKWVIVVSFRSFAYEINNDDRGASTPAIWVLGAPRLHAVLAPALTPAAPSTWRVDRAVSGCEPRAALSP